MPDLPSDAPIIDQIEAARAEARLTGKKVTLQFPKQRLLAELPAAGADPRMALMTGDMVIIDFAQNEEITVGELRKLCREAQTELGKQKLLSVLPFPDSHLVVLLKQDLIALREGRATAAASGAALSAPLPTEQAPAGTNPLPK